jgi:hypothetical protein
MHNYYKLKDIQYLCHFIMNWITFSALNKKCNFVPQIPGHGTIYQHTSNSGVPTTFEYILLRKLTSHNLWVSRSYTQKILKHTLCIMRHITQLLWKYYGLQKQISPQLTIIHNFHFTVCCLFTCTYWSCSYHVTKAELNIKTSNTQSTAKRPKQLLGEVQYRGAKTSGKLKKSLS